jgi:hypothetical protein
MGEFNLFHLTTVHRMGAKIAWDRRHLFQP